MLNLNLNQRTILKTIILVFWRNHKPVQDALKNAYTLCYLPQVMGTQPATRDKQKQLSINLA